MVTYYYGVICEEAVKNQADECGRYTCYSCIRISGAHEKSESTVCERIYRDLKGSVRIG